MSAGAAKWGYQADLVIGQNCRIVENGDGVQWLNTIKAGSNCESGANGTSGLHSAQPDSDRRLKREGMGNFETNPVGAQQITLMGCPFARSEIGLIVIVVQASAMRLWTWKHTF